MKAHPREKKQEKNITQRIMYLTFFTYPQTAKLLVTAYSNESKPELEGLRFIQVVAVWHTKQPQNTEAAASKVRKKIVSLCMTTKKKKRQASAHANINYTKTSNYKCGK